MKTLPLGVAGLQQENMIQYGQILAGATLSALPMIVVFVVFQKFFTRGLTVGAVKG
jgi:multiple sugar transport system permease protein